MLKRTLRHRAGRHDAAALYAELLDEQWPDAPPELFVMLRRMNRVLRRHLFVCRWALRDPAVHEVISHYVAPDEVIDVSGAFCAAIPESEINAWVQRAERGHLILLSGGLIDAFGSYAHLVYSATGLVGSGRFKGLPGLPDGGILSIEEAAEAVRVMFGDDPGVAMFLGSRRERSMMIAGMQFQSAVLFIIAHELAHVLLGHLGESISTGREMAAPPGRADDQRWTEMMFSKQQEIAADDVGLALGVAAMKRLRTRLFTPDARFDPCVLFFGFIEAYELHVVRGEGDSAREYFEQRSAQSHSIPRVRRNICIENHLTSADQAGLPSASGLSLMIDRVNGQERFAPDPEAMSEIRDRAALSRVSIDELFAISRSERSAGVAMEVEGLAAAMSSTSIERAIDALCTVVAAFLDDRDERGQFSSVTRIFQLGNAVLLFELSDRSIRSPRRTEINRWMERVERAIPELEELLDATISEVMFVDDEGTNVGSPVSPT